MSPGRGRPELARETDTNHPGVLIFDEPGQQAMAEVSLRALLAEAASIAGRERQVLFAMSESTVSLSDVADGLDVNVLEFDAKLLQLIPTSGVTQASGRRRRALVGLSVGSAPTGVA